jgi:hypothetical protein
MIPVLKTWQRPGDLGRHDEAPKSLDMSVAIAPGRECPDQPRNVLISCNAGGVASEFRRGQRRSALMPLPRNRAMYWAPGRRTQRSRVCRRCRSADDIWCAGPRSRC